MNLKIDKSGFKLEIQNGDGFLVERCMVAAFAFLEGESFVAKYESLPVKDNSKEQSNAFQAAIKGIKIFNGVNHYQCSYKCLCGNGGKRFVKKDAADTTCHSCGALLNIVPAVEGKAHDDDYNYYIAY